MYYNTIETLVSNSNKATTFRQLNKTVPFLAHPVGILRQNGVGKNCAEFCGTAQVFLYLSCTRAWCSTKCRSNVIHSTFTNVFKKFCHVFNVFYIFV